MDGNFEKQLLFQSARRWEFRGLLVFVAVFPILATVVILTLVALPLGLVLGAAAAAILYYPLGFIAARNKAARLACLRASVCPKCGSAVQFDEYFGFGCEACKGMYTSSGEPAASGRFSSRKG